VLSRLIKLGAIVIHAIVERKKIQFELGTKISGPETKFVVHDLT
jgi:hypothetical protein